jgi:protein phosphatase PTC7
MHHAASCAAGGEKNSSPHALLRDAASLLAAERIAGGATALIAHASADGRIDAANLGDISLFVARADGAIAASAPRGLVSFDTPRQLGALFDDGPPIRFDVAADALLFDAQLESGGWVVAATDGLTDNVFMADIASEIKAAAARDDANLGILARELVSAARAASNDRSRDSPFSLNAKDHDVLWSKGGRPDDITVFVARYVGPAHSCSATPQGHDVELVSAARGLVPVNAASPDR